LFLVLAEIEENSDEAVLREAIKVKQLIRAALLHPLNGVINQGPVIESMLASLLKDLETSS
jgi:hypothetical protein